MFPARKITLAAMFIALGLLLPIAFHGLGLGTVFLPMHIPVLLAGLMAGPGVGLVVGAAIPGLSSIATGMPPLLPMVPMMTVELAIYGLIAGLLHHSWRKGLIVSLLGAMLAGRVAYGVVGALFLPLLGITGISVWGPITYGVVTSWPGLLVQLVLIPLLVQAVRRAGFLNRPSETRVDTR